MPSSSTHDNPALTSNDDLLLMNQLEACRGGHAGPVRPETEAAFGADVTDRVIAYRAAEPEDVRSATLIAGTADFRAHGADECGTGRAVIITHASVVPLHQDRALQWRNPREVRLSLGIPVVRSALSPARLP